MVLLDFDGNDDRIDTLLRRYQGDHVRIDCDNPAGHSARIERYFQGELDALDAIEVETGGTAFQRQVWAALRTIPVGTTATYGAIASAVGRPTASRAVGMTNGANPVGIVLPCHRVVGANGTLTGYAGGLDRKQWLLRHEGALL